MKMLGERGKKKKEVLLNLLQNHRELLICFEAVKRNWCRDMQSNCSMKYNMLSLSINSETESSSNKFYWFILWHKN